MKHLKEKLAQLRSKKSHHKPEEPHGAKMVEKEYNQDQTKRGHRFGKKWFPFSKG